MRKRCGQAPGARSPHYVVRPSEKPWWEPFATGAVALSDFGSSFVVGELPKIITFTKAFAAPEVFFKESGPAGYPSDIWSLGCTMLDICTDDQLFNSLNRHTLSRAPFDLEIHLGPLPEPYRSAWENMLLWDFDDADDTYDDENMGNLELGEEPFDHYCSAEDTTDLEHTNDKADEAESNDNMEPATGTLGELQELRNAMTLKAPFKSTIEAVLWRERPLPKNSSDDLASDGREMISLFHYREDDIVEFATLLKSIFKYDPEERATIDQILQSSYLKRNSKNFMNWVSQRW
ncbi:kinase-like domain-containing protein [Xylariaceae sp. FL1272]|nr:kinase-like domain-containing protein [Xylariaceae sp. FL1272]